MVVIGDHELTEGGVKVRDVKTQDEVSSISIQLLIKA